MTETRGPSSMPVWGWQGWRDGKQSREVVAALSMAAAARAAGYKYPRQMFCLTETGNAEERATALAEPGVVFWRPLDDRAPFRRGLS